MARLRKWLRSKVMLHRHRLVQPGDYYVTFDGERWVVMRRGEIEASHSTQQAAIDRAKVWVRERRGRVIWTNRTGQQQGHYEWRP